MSTDGGLTAKARGWRPPGQGRSGGGHRGRTARLGIVVLVALSTYAHRWLGGFGRTRHDNANINFRYIIDRDVDRTANVTANVTNWSKLCRPTRLPVQEYRTTNAGNTRFDRFDRFDADVSNSVAAVVRRRHTCSPGPGPREPTLSVEFSLHCRALISRSSTWRRR